MNYKWILTEQAPPDFLSKFPEYPAVVSQLIFSRGLDTPEKINQFFNPQYETDLHDPFLLKDMDKACERVKRAVGQKEKIVIYADYDVDGVSAATVLGEYFKNINYPFEVYMPDRQKEGHGVNRAALESIILAGAKLIITLDCGTTNVKEVAWAKSKEVDMIVADHHQTVSGRPEAAAFINQHQEGDNYPFKGLCGTGLAFKLHCALRSFSEGGIGSNQNHGQEKWLLDLVALATVADMAPLLDENRVLVKHGLFVLAKTKRLGLKKLMESAGVKARHDLGTLSTNLDSFTLGFTLGPRINAASRMAHANLAYELLTSNNEAKIDELVVSLNDNNRKRQQIVDKVLKEVKARVDAYKELPSFIMEGSADWSVNLLGLVASKITEKYHRPVMLYQISPEGKCKGSLRTIAGFDLMKALGSVSEDFIQYGGHPDAGGCSFKVVKADKIKSGLNSYAENILTAELLLKKLQIDIAVSLSEISWGLIDWLDKFKPWGMANSRPKFVSKNVLIQNVILMGQHREHLKIMVSDSSMMNRQLPLLMFRHNGFAQNLKIGDTLDIVYEVDVNEWNGNREIQLMLVDFKKYE
ncbi:MAG: single-stranded-DNA-specific exonuclease RecJ [Parcubacteria group bacterium]|nr:single-stranded-DNA-specific exonuclease RecJ [Parcubacteria group bacterium]